MFCLLKIHSIWCPCVVPTTATRVLVLVLFFSLHSHPERCHKFNAQCRCVFSQTTLFSLALFTLMPYATMGASGCNRLESFALPRGGGVCYLFPPGRDYGRERKWHMRDKRTITTCALQITHIHTATACLPVCSTKSTCALCCSRQCYMAIFSTWRW